MIQERSTQASSSSSDIRVSTLSAPFTHSHWNKLILKAQRPSLHPHASQSSKHNKSLWGWDDVQQHSLLNWHLTHSRRCCCPLMSCFIYVWSNCVKYNASAFCIIQTSFPQESLSKLHDCEELPAWTVSGWGLSALPYMSVSEECKLHLWVMSRERCFTPQTFKWE